MLTNTKVYNDYSETAITNFNENYTSLVTKNVASIATKVAVAGIAAYAAGKAAEKQAKDRGGNGGGLIGLIVGIAAGAIAGAGVSATIKPDLRCWRTLPSNFQIRRIFLEPGTYNFEFKSNTSRAMGEKNFSKISVDAGKLVVINFRSL